ncbi:MULTISPECIES: N-6 DNA methylase [Ralstonia]|uniref:N-6 DNA methylase n=1 Tax=Ralstonia TaxID=48736 RepID=UPI000A6D70C7|nr:MULTISPECIES: N-6 DNA methylase [Ralstonia]PLT16458.1 hypothetical protein CXP34_20185 [Ralstonia mannitolilytica]
MPSNLLESAAATELFDSVSIERQELNLLGSLDEEKKKRDGIFFTPSDLADKLLSDVAHEIPQLRLLDPACGTGNLLLAAAAHLPVDRSLARTLKAWNRRLFGLDINEAFVSLAKKKLVALARARGAIGSGRYEEHHYESLLANIRCGNFLAEKQQYKGVINAIVTNPPFSPMPTPSDVEWATGLVNSAAVFADYCIQILPQEGRMLAILPDVLRSGSRYEKWRAKIGATTKVTTEVHGAFGDAADIDVFLMRGYRAAQPLSLVVGGRGVELNTIDRYFHVSVGAVVPHRDPKTGPSAPYAHAKTLPKWAEVTELPERIRHLGRKAKGPMVVIRRTSSPSDRVRTVATLINCHEPVAVENHLIVLTPRSGSLEDCRLLIDHLRSDMVTTYLNESIRCRHLTVRSVKSIPFELGDRRE